MELQLRRLGVYLRFVWDKLRHRWGTLDDPMRTSYYLALWREAARAAGARITELPGGFCEIAVNGSSTRVYQNLVMLDHPVTMKLARSKPLVLDLLAAGGIGVPEHAVFSLNDLAPARALLERAGTIVVKPANGTAGGEGVTTNVRTTGDLKRAAIFASLFDRAILAERQIGGLSYRLLYLRGTLLDAIRRASPSVTGDGRSTIRQLIAAENARRASLAGSEGLTWLRIDNDCRNTLRSAGLTPASVPAAGAVVTVKQAANDNSARENESVPHLLCASVVADGARAAAMLGVELAGVDLITTDPGRPLAESGGVINEVNTTPGLHYHYQTTTPGARVLDPILHELLHNQRTIA